MGFLVLQNTKVSERNFYQLVFALAVLVLTALPPRAEAIIRMGSANTNSVANGLVGYWPLDGAVTNWATGQTRDRSGGNTGQLIGLSTTSPICSASR
jgi:hypothetical protein